MRILLAVALLSWALPVASQEPQVTHDVSRHSIGDEAGDGSPLDAVLPFLWRHSPVAKQTVAVNTTSSRWRVVPEGWWLRRTVPACPRSS